MTPTASNLIALLVRVTGCSVSQWKERGNIPEGQLFKLAARIERLSEGRISRKTLFPQDWERNAVPGPVTEHQGPAVGQLRQASDVVVFVWPH